VLTQTRLDEIVPIHNAVMEKRTFIEWDKDDIETLRMMKVDVLALGMLTCIRKSFDLMRAHGLGNVDLASVPRRILQLTRCCKRPTASAPFRSRAAPRWPCCPG
jgi:error-prone DNA polymerase